MKIIKLISTALTILFAFLMPGGRADVKPITFKKGQRICLVGNALAERFQHDGYFESTIQLMNKGKELSIRNLAYSGASVNYDKEKLPINLKLSGDYLRRCKADVILMFYGLNESFNLNEEQFKTDLIKEIKEKQSFKYNGQTNAELILFSPIAFENLKKDYFSDGVQENLRLKTITQIMEAVAQSEGIQFVNLFESSLKLYQSSKQALTVNGIHLNTYGNRLITQTIAEKLMNQKALGQDEHFERLRQAVLEKNVHWWHRYRATDSNDIWGSRRRMDDNQTVLLRELDILDVMTQNRDRHIWALASNIEHKIDDSNIPETIQLEVYKSEKEEWAPYLNEEESLAKMKVAKGLTVNQFASEKEFPDLINPVQMSVDTRGRLWVAVWPSYPKWDPTTKMEDKLIILEDTNKDGKADKSKVFCHVHNPTAFEFWNGGVLVVSAPNLIFFKDTDGDDVADEKVIMLQGLDSADTHHAANALRYGPDGGFYYQRGIFHTHMIETPYGPHISKNPGMYRYDPTNEQFNFHVKSLGPNAHGISFARWGYHYANDGTRGTPFQVILNRDKKNILDFRANALRTPPTRPVASCLVLSGSHMPTRMQGNYLKANVLGFQGVKQYRLEMKNGVARGMDEQDFLVSSDPNFRPSSLRMGADGSVYVADWSNRVIGHSGPNVRAPIRDHKHGRIYRVSALNRPLQKEVDIDGVSIEALLDLLKHHDTAVRYRTRIELSERDEAEVYIAVKKWMKQFSYKKDDDAHHLLEALWLLQRLHKLEQGHIDLMLTSPNEHARRAAKVMQHIESDAYKYKEVVFGKVKAKPSVNDSGKMIYNRPSHCVTCHRKNGKGVKPVYPPLAKSEWVTGDPEILIKLTLHGLDGSPIKVAGVQYGGTPELPKLPVMNGFKDLLTDKEIASVLTYIRSMWGNKASAISEDMVKKVRMDTEERNTHYSPKELINQ